MKLLGKAVLAATQGFLISQICGCVSSSLVDVWHDPSFQAPPLGKMMVVAVRKDATKRRIWEDAFTGELAKHSVAATSSYSLFPDAPPDTNQLIAAVQANGFDGILVILRRPTDFLTKCDFTNRAMDGHFIEDAAVPCKGEHCKSALVQN